LANWTVSIGPIQTKVKGIKPNPQADGLGYNPRCLSRDVNKHAAYRSRDEVITELIKNSKDIATFQNRMQGDFPTGYLGVHSAGHYTIGGDAGSDFFNSPSDPVSSSSYTFYPPEALTDSIRPFTSTTRRSTAHGGYGRTKTLRIGGMQLQAPSPF
jgi:hypothetical protein